MKASALIDGSWSGGKKTCCERLWSIGTNFETEHFKRRILTLYSKEKGFPPSQKAPWMADFQHTDFENIWQSHSHTLSSCVSAAFLASSSTLEQCSTCFKKPWKTIFLFDVQADRTFLWSFWGTFHLTTFYHLPLLRPIKKVVSSQVPSVRFAKKGWDRRRNQMQAVRGVGISWPHFQVRAVPPPRLAHRDHQARKYLSIWSRTSTWY